MRLFLAGLLCAVVVYAGMTWWGAQHPPALSVGDEAIVTSSANTVVPLAGTRDELVTLRNDTRGGVTFNGAQLMVKYGFAVISSGSHVRILEIGTKDDLEMARVQQIDNPLLSGWTATQWLTAVPKPTP